MSHLNNEKEALVKLYVLMNRDARSWGDVQCGYDDGDLVSYSDSEDDLIMSIDLLSIFNKLSKYNQKILKCRLDNESIIDVSREMGIPPNTTRLHLIKAMNSWKRLLIFHEMIKG